MKKLAELIDHVDFLVVSDSAGEFPQLAHLENEVFLDLVKLAPNELKRVEVPLLPVLLQIVHLFLELVELAKDRGDLQQDGLLTLTSIL